MRFSKATALAVVAGAQAQDMSLCDKYTTALLKDNTADNQATLLTLVVNTVVIGNYTKPNVGIKVDGILAPGKFGGKDVNLLPYFTGELESTNRGGDKGVSVNFLDDGGAAPLMKNMPANGTKSQQYFLLTHLYQFFGALLGCSKQGMPGFDAYAADASMYDVHKFMALDESEVGYFITQVGNAAASFGVEDADVQAVGAALNSLFGARCAPATAVIPAQGEQLQSICIADTCPLAEKATCDKYDAVVEPEPVSSSSSASATPTATSSGGASTSMTYPTGTSTGSPIPTAGAATNGLGLAAVAGGVLAFIL